MKKRYIAAAGLAAVTAFGAFGHHLSEQAIAACNAGDVKECQGIAELHGTDYFAADRITNPAYAEALIPVAAAEAKAKAEAAAKAKEADRWKPTKYNVAMLALSCEQKQIRPNLKDPNSFRELGHSYEMKANNTHVYVTVDYTATNGFGGRVRAQKTCSYSV